MALEASFRELSSQLRKLHDMLVALRLTIAEDKPLKGEAALVDHLEDSILDLMGSLDESLAAARAAQKGVGHPLNLDGARRALTSCQDHFHEIELKYLAELASFEKLKDLEALGGRGGEWRPWAASAKDGVEQCRQPLDGASRALAACWQEIAERVGMTSVSVQATNIGQKIVAGRTAEEMVEESFT
jgi:hypothetical protein